MNKFNEIDITKLTNNFKSKIKTRRSTNYEIN